MTLESQGVNASYETENRNTVSAETALREADERARCEAINVRGSYLVQAPAGSGKTELLTQRLLALLGEAVDEPESVLAITFTNKAAAEMRQRIQASLLRADTQPEPEAEPDCTNWRLAKRVLSRSQREGWDLVENPGRLRIMTIDALCGSIAQQLPLLSEFGSQPTITRDAEKWYRLAAQEAIHYWVTQQTNAPRRETSAFSEPIDLLLRVDNDAQRLVDLMARLLAVRDQWLVHVVNPEFLGAAHDSGKALQRHIESSVQWVLRETYQRLETLISQRYPGIRDQVETHLGAARFGFDVLGDWSSPLAIQLQARTESQTTPHSVRETSLFWAQAVELLTTGTAGKKNFRKPRGVTKALGFPAATVAATSAEKRELKEKKAAFQAFLESVCEADDLLEVLNEVSLLPAAMFTQPDANTLGQLLELLMLAVACLKMGFQSAGEVDFCEISLGAMRALQDTENHDVIAHLSQRYQHILVDEFQDTSLTQYHLLLQLISDWQVEHVPSDVQPPTLFFVGDPMQSIYRFRQAEVGLFLQVKTQGMGPVPLRYLRLTRNFRSDPNIVDWVNVHFQRIFPGKDSVSDGRVAYSASLAGRSGKTLPTMSESPGTGQELPPCGVRCEWCVDSDAEVVQRCVDVVLRVRNAEPDASIAILVRGRRHLRAILPALSQQEIPYEAVEARALSAEPLVQDLLTLTSVLAEPHNLLAWAALLRSPLCGLDLRDVEVVFKTLGAEVNHDVWSLFVSCLDVSNRIPSLSDTGHALIRRLVDPMRLLIDDYPYVSLPVKARWAAWASGLLARVTERDMDCVEAYWTLLEQYARDDTVFSVDDFSQALEKSYGSILSQQANPVQIMTIHKSKGLEFDHVLIPFAEKTGAMDDTPLLVTQSVVFEHGEGILMAPLPDKVQSEGVGLYHYLRHLERQKSLQELKRVLYVAVTRGKKSVTLVSKIAVDVEKGALRTARGDAFLSSVLESLTPEEHQQLRAVIAGYCSANNNSEPEQKAPWEDTEDGVSDVDLQVEKPWLLSRLPINADVWRWDLAVPVPWQNARGGDGRLHSPYWRQRVKANSTAEVMELMAASTVTDVDVERQLGLFLHECVEVHSDVERLADFVAKGWERFAMAWLDEAGISNEEQRKGLDRLSRCFHHLLQSERGRWIMQKRSAMALEWNLHHSTDEEVVVHRLDRCFIDEDTVWIVDFKLSHLAHRSDTEILAVYGPQGERYCEAIETGWREPAHGVHRISFGLYFPENDRWVVSPIRRPL